MPQLAFAYRKRVFHAERLVGSAAGLTVLQRGLLSPNSRSVAGVMLPSAAQGAPRHALPVLIPSYLSFSLWCGGGAMCPWQGA